jgi:hypothetical protein
MGSPLLYKIKIINLCNKVNCATTLLNSRTAKLFWNVRYAAAKLFWYVRYAAAKLFWYVRYAAQPLLCVDTHFTLL